jgi:hypothetical protein
MFGSIQRAATITFESILDPVESAKSQVQTVHLVLAKDGYPAHSVASGHGAKPSSLRKDIGTSYHRYQQTGSIHNTVSFLGFCQQILTLFDRDWAPQ